MAAGFVWKVYIGTTAGNERPAGTADADNLNLMNSDTYDSSGTAYQTGTTGRISVPGAGTNYSYERWGRGLWSGTYNTIETVKFWKSSGTLSDGALALVAGVTSTAATPVNTDSSKATAAVPTTSTAALEPGFNSTTEYTAKYFVMQLDVPSTVTTPGDIGTQTFTMRYDES